MQLLGRGSWLPPVNASWLRPLDSSARDSWRSQQKRCAEAMKAANKEAAPLDLVLYGDSLTTLNLKSQGNAAMAAQWQRLFAGRRTLPLGMNGCTVEWLAWRIVQGGERPAQAPKVIAFLIGINNVYKKLGPPQYPLEALLGWTRAAFPTSRLLVVGMLPTLAVPSAELAAHNILYSQLAARQGGTYVGCGRGMSPSDTSLFNDGLHLTVKGQDRVARCLRMAAFGY
ncbi:hypothetical protein COHA_002794 [Chlorella ohadii]|uniref:SGNH hydrolase-type esterase domain-containing protein n=1 Tax=Chlorella ohadii TaxID=2649997 RepID=A0AAD5DTU9_9CHLO|nr:hypothetical protein COHA_002794 [Chlorella ohadii]